VLFSSTLLAYAPSFFYDFVDDDWQQIFFNPRIQSWSFLPQILREHLWTFMTGSEHVHYYRPVFSIWLLINRSVYDVAPMGWHISTVFAHLCVVALVYLLAKRLLGSAKAGVVAALLFAIHPARVESVAWIAGVSEPLFTIFILIAFLAYLQAREPGAPAKWWGLSIFAFGLGIFAKESAAVFPLTVFAYEMLFPQPTTLAFAGKLRSAIAKSLYYAPMLLLYMLARLFAFGGMMHVAARSTTKILFLGLPSVMWFYCEHLILPFRLSHIYDPAYQPGTGQIVVPCIGVLLTVTAVVYCARKSKVLSFAAIWIVIYLLLILTAGFYSSIDLLHDRYLYVPSIGFAILVVGILQRLPRSSAAQIIRTGVVVTMVAAYLTVTLYEERFFANNSTVYARAAELAPNSYLANMLYGLVLMDQGNVDGSLKQLQKANEIAHGNCLTLSTLGLWNYHYKNYSESESYYLKSIAGKSTAGRSCSDAAMFYGLGKTRLAMGRPEAAIGPLREATVRNPGSLNYRLELGSALVLAGRLPEAIDEYQTTLESNPQEEGLRRYIELLRQRMASESKNAPSHERSPETGTRSSPGGVP
jgi:Flp pilus assembly protein TadD